jgi:hypothetical protein
MMAPSKYNDERLKRVLRACDTPYSREPCGMGCTEKSLYDEILLLNKTLSRVLSDSYPDTGAYVELGYVELNEDGDVESYTVTRHSKERDLGDGEE